MANTDVYNMKLLSIPLGSGLVLLALMTILPTMAFAATDYSNVMFGSQPVYKWIAEIEQEKGTAISPVTYDNPYLESTDLVFGTVTLDQAIHDINAARLDTHEWISHISVLPGGEFFDPSSPSFVQVYDEAEYGTTAQQVSVQK